MEKYLSSVENNLLKNVDGLIGFEEESLESTIVCFPHSSLVLGRDLWGQSTLGTTLILLAWKESKLSGSFPQLIFEACFPEKYTFGYID